MRRKVRGTTRSNHAWLKQHFKLFITINEVDPVKIWRVFKISTTKMKLKQKYLLSWYFFKEVNLFLLILKGKMVCHGLSRKITHLLSTRYLCYKKINSPKAHTPLWIKKGAWLHGFRKKSLYCNSAARKCQSIWLIKSDRTIKCLTVYPHEWDKDKETTWNIVLQKYPAVLSTQVLLLNYIITIKASLCAKCMKVR